jgi:hypothetical protein
LFKKRALYDKSYTQGSQQVAKPWSLHNTRNTFRTEFRFGSGARLLHHPCLVHAVFELFSKPLLAEKKTVAVWHQQGTILLRIIGSMRDTHFRYATAQSTISFILFFGKSETYRREISSTCTTLDWRSLPAHIVQMTDMSRRICPRKGFVILMCNRDFRSSTGAELRTAKRDCNVR